MELWIRSQDKADLVCTKRIYAYENTIRTNVYETIGFTILGEYATKERALEVLNRIQEVVEYRYSNSIIGKDGFMILEMPEE